jgi:hypothetical protein
MGWNVLIRTCHQRPVDDEHMGWWVGEKWQCGRLREDRFQVGAVCEGAAGIHVAQHWSRGCFMRMQWWNFRVCERGEYFTCLSIWIIASVLRTLPRKVIYWSMCSNGLLLLCGSLGWFFSWFVAFVRSVKAACWPHQHSKLCVALLS